MSRLRDAVRLPSTDDTIAPVTLLDADGHVTQVVSADEFRRTHPAASRGFASAAIKGHRRRAR